MFARNLRFDVYEKRGIVLPPQNELETRQTMNEKTGSRPIPPQDYHSAQEVMNLLRIGKRRLYELAGRKDDPLPLRTFPEAKRGSFCDRRELRDWVLRNTVLMWLYLFGQPDESLRALRGREAPCGIRSTPGSSPRSSGGR